MIRPTKKAKNELLALAEEITPTCRGWFAMLPDDVADLLTDARDAIKAGQTTATIKGLWQTAKQQYPDKIKCSLSAFRQWFQA